MRIGMPFSQEQFLSNLRKIDRQLGDALAQLSDPRRVVRPSDDPQAAAQILQLEDQRRTLETRENGIGLARTHLQMSENALLDLNGLLTIALQKATQGASEPNTALQRIAIAGDVARLGDDAHSLANQRIAGRYLFSGTRTDAPPYDSSGAYQGNGSLIEVPLDEGRVAINMPGNIAFGAVGDGGALDVLDRLESALRSDNTDAIRGMIDEIESQIELNGVRIASFGSRQARVDEAQLRIGDTRLELSRRLDELGSADLAQVISDVQRLEAGYQATLQAGARLYGPTFFDFLG